MLQGQRVRGWCSRAMFPGDRDIQGTADPYVTFRDREQATNTIDGRLNELYYTPWYL